MTVPGPVAAVTWVSASVTAPDNATRKFWRCALPKMVVLATTPVSFKRAALTTAPTGSAGIKRVARVVKVVPSLMRPPPENEYVLVCTTFAQVALNPCPPGTVVFSQIA